MFQILEDIIDLLDFMAVIFLRYILPVVGVLAVVMSCMFWDGTDLSKARMVWSVGALILGAIIRIRFLKVNGGKRD